MNITKYFHIYTIGCQMNVYDSDRMATLLQREGFLETAQPENADLIVVNTCAIRDKAEQKVYSLLGRLAVLKQKRTELLIAVGGCVAQQEGRAILERVPAVDIVFGAQAVGRLPELIQQTIHTRRRITDIQMNNQIDETGIAGEIPKTRPVNAFVTIMQGCDNFCAYCVVPYVRGREMSRQPESIVREIRALVADGVREVTLLGQNVNSYGKKEKLPSFSTLLTQINQIQGLARIRFTTSHPKDLSDDLIRAFRELEKLCHHIHLPVQSGSDQILSTMRRRYTRDDYLRKIEALRKSQPNIAITSDFIVGFPGETEADFEQSLSLIREVAYDGLFAFRYSDRPNAPAATFSHKTPEAEIADRLNRLLALQENYTLTKNQRYIGLVQPVLVEGWSKKSGHSEQDPDISPQWTGRTATNKIVNFTPQPEDGTDYTGMILPLFIEEALSHSLRGRLETIAEKRYLHAQGEKIYAV